MPTTSSIQHSRDAPAQMGLKRRHRPEGPAGAVAAAQPEQPAAREGTPEFTAGAEGTAGTPKAPGTPIADPAPASALDDIDADDPAAAIPELANAGTSAAAGDDTSDSDSEEELRQELERARMRSKQAEDRRKRHAATASAAAKRYDADVLFRYDANASSGGAGAGRANKAPFNDPTANEFHAKFLKRFFK